MAAEDDLDDNAATTDRGARSFVPLAVSFGLTGFVIGVLVTLLAVGVATRSGDSSGPSATLLPATPLPDAQMTDRVTKIVQNVLGPAYPGPKKSRVISITVAPVVPNDVISPPVPTSLTRYQSVAVSFLLNDHPLGKSWRLKAAKADVFAIMKALYITQLPVYNLQLDGYYPVDSGPHPALRKVVVAYMDHVSADGIPWRRWGRTDESRLWARLPYRYVNPRFG